MPRRATLVNAFTKGVLDPALAERIDLAHYYQGVRTGRNVEFTPQGGFRRRAGTALSSPRRLRRCVEPVQLTAGMFTAVNGGTAANLVDQSASTLFTTLPVSGAPFVLFEIDLGSALPVAFVDLEAFSCQTAYEFSDGVLAVEYWDGAAWVLIGAFEGGAQARRSIRTQARTRRFALPPGLAVSTRFVRAIVTGAPVIGTVSIGGVKLWVERTPLSAVRGVAFSKSTADTYQLVFTDRNADVYDGDAYLGAIPTPWPSEIVRDLSFEQSLDTMFVFHEDVPTRQIVRQGAVDEWNIERCAFTDVPNLTAGVAFSAPQNEKQSISLPGLAVGQSVFVLMDDQLTAPVTYATTLAQLATDLAVAIGALPGLGAGGILPSANPVPVPSVTFEFTGATNGYRAWPRLHGIVVSSALMPTTKVLQRGLPATGTVMGDKTGWPRCGALNQARLFLGGFRAAPQTILASVVGQPSSFLAGTTADKSITMTFDTDQVETIQEIFVGRHLQVFTDRGEWWSDNRTFSATTPVNWVLASRYGIEPGTTIAFADNSTVYVQSGDAGGDGTSAGSTLRDAVYSNDTQNYESAILSLLAPQLVTDAVSLAYRAGNTAADGGQVFVVNADGTMAVLSLLKAQEVMAWSQWTTTGAWRDVFVDPKFRVFFLTERNGQNWIERRDPDRLTDATVTKTGASSTAVTGLAIHDGRAVWCFADRGRQGPFTVAAGALTLAAAASEVFAGLDFPVDLDSLPMREKLNAQMPFRPPARIYEVGISVMSCGPFTFAVGDDDGEELEPGYTDGGPLSQEATGEELLGGDDDAPLLDRLFTGIVPVEEIEGWWEHPRWSIRQRAPAPLHVRAVRIELSQKG